MSQRSKGARPGGAGPHVGTHAAHAEGATVAALGELGLIEAITSRLRGGIEPTLGPGDDSAIVDVGATGQAVISTDVLVEDVDFRTAWSTAGDVGHHAVAASVADIEAMGAVPVAVLVSLILHSETSVDWVLEAVDGMVNEACRAGAALVGGDVSGGGQIALAMTAVGRLDGTSAVTRSGARPGDAVALAGPVGRAAAGLAVLGRGFRSPRSLVEAHRRPTPPYGQGRAAAAAGATSMIDVSDGLLMDLGHLARASRVAIGIDSQRIALDEDLRSAAAAFNADPLKWALSGGDDHALIATFPPESHLPAGFQAIGRVDEGDPGVLVDGTAVEPEGYEHFRS